MLERAAARGSRPALVDSVSGRAISYADLPPLVDRAAAGLWRIGLRTGDVCAILAGNTIEYPIAMLALAIVCALLVGSNVPFFGAVTANIIAFVKDLGSNGLVGLIALGIILWLFSKRSIA